MLTFIPFAAFDYLTAFAAFAFVFFYHSAAGGSVTLRYRHLRGQFIEN